MRIVALTAQNVKRLRAVAIAPGDRPVVEIAGRNGQGKSSVLDAILYALGGKAAVAAEPLRHGAEAGFAEVDLGELVARREFLADGSQRLRLTTRDGGTVAKAQQRLDELLVRLAFDPGQFLASSPAEQSELLARVVGFDAAAAAGKRKTLYDQRTLINRDVARETAAARSAGPFTGAVAVDLAPLWAEMKAAQGAAAAAAKHDLELVQARSRVSFATRRLEQLRRDLAEAEAEDRAAERALAELVAAAPAPVPDLAQLRSRLEAAEAQNARAASEAAARRHGDEAARLQAEADRLTAAIEEHDRGVVQALAAAAWPVPGLSLDAERGVLYNGVPLAQASTAERIRVACAVGMACNPQLRVMLVREGSLLDESSMALLGSLAEEHGFQVWVERVGGAGDGAIVIEDGAVAG